MRKNSPRKWLHACLDLLPVFLIPVFMIYSHRHTLTEQAQAVPVYETNEVNSVNDLQINKVYHANNLIIDDVEGYNDFEIEILSCEDVDWSTNYNNIVFNEINIENYLSNTKNKIRLGVFGTNLELTLTNENGYSSFVISDNYSEIFKNCDFIITDNYYLNGFKTYYINYDMFTNYPITSSDFNVYEIEQGSPNIMNVFMDSFNTSIDKYFNMGNVFNLSGVYDWFNNNIFSGNAPQVIYSVWNIALYELVMDLLFLLYGLFMWFIDIVQHIMDKPFKSVK